MATWMYVGNNPQYNSDPNTNLTASEINSIVGYTATGQSELMPLEMHGESPDWSQWSPDGYAPTYYPAATGVQASPMDYINPETEEAVSGVVITAFVPVQYNVYDLDENGDPYVLTTLQGSVVQMSNGDTFFRPHVDTIDEWSTIDRFYSLEVVSATQGPDNVNVVASVGFDSSIYDTTIICFVRGTMIKTSNGEIGVENLRQGDLVLTRDRGYQPIRWIGSRKLSRAELKVRPNLRPIRIRAGALGHNIPETDLLVSPQHRVLARSSIALRMFRASEVLAAAKQFLQLDGFDIAEDIEEVEYFHFLCDQHEVVYSNGAATESLYTGATALKSVGPAAREEIFTLLPELRDRDPEEKPHPVRELLTGRMARKLAVRHVLNQKPLVSAQN